MSEDERKIIIDEGWKAQVQKEKEEAARKASETPEETPAEVAPDEAADAPDAPEDPEVDEGASFTALIGSLATQIMYALGLVGDPNGGQVMVNLDAARYTLDVLDVLKDKTAGNLTEEESTMLEQTRSELEQVFAMRVQQFQEQAMQQAGVNLDNLKGE